MDPLIAEELPEWFMPALHAHKDLADLWENRGKPAGTDRSNSGYDYSIASYLLNLGFTNTDEIATIIKHRPIGYKAMWKENSSM